MTFGDRTTEFSNVAQTLRNKGLAPQPRTRKNEPISNKINFNKVGSEIGRHIHESSEKLKELTRLAKSNSLFDDPADKIEELTGIIKLDIQNIRKKIDDLQNLSNSFNGSQNKHTKNHNVNIIDTLRVGLSDTTDNFAKVLEVRTENLKSQQDRKERFIGARKITAPSVIYQPFSPVLEDGQEVDDVDDVSITLPLVQTRDQFIQQRSQSIRTIESTIEELRGIMSQIARISQEQDYLITRIDENIMNTEEHVNGAYKQLVEYLPKITSQRWLFLKIFAVLAIFIVLFVVFFM